MEEILTVENYCDLLVFKENYDILKKLKTNEINSLEKTSYYKEISYKLTLLSNKFNNLSLTENNRIMIDNILKINDINEMTNIKIKKEKDLNVDNNFLYKKKMPNIKKEKNSLDLIELSSEDYNNSNSESSEDNNSNSEFSENGDLIYIDDKSVDDWQDNNWQECVDSNSDDDENNLKSINLSPYTETAYFTNRGRKTQKIKYF